EYDITGVDSAKLHKCESMLEDGSKCGRTFATVSALRAHQTFSKEPSHKMRSVLTSWS
ncbi:unnamed protein product, partial [Prorocentrum cordatum]